MRRSEDGDVGDGAALEHRDQQIAPAALDPDLPGLWTGTQTNDGARALPCGELRDRMAELAQELTGLDLFEARG